MSSDQLRNKFEETLCKSCCDSISHYFDFRVGAQRIWYLPIKIFLWYLIRFFSRMLVLALN